MEKIDNRLQRIEAEIKSIVGENPLRFYLDYPTKENVERIQELLGFRKEVLDGMFAFSQDEIKRVERTNAQLLEQTKLMHKRACDLYRTLLKHGQDDEFDDDYEIDGAIRTTVEYDPKDGDDGTVLHLDNDEYYGSDFAYMLYVIQENAEAYHGTCAEIERCGIGHKETNTPEMTDEEFGCDYRKLDDGQSWNEGFLRDQHFDHICFCHAFHSLEDHHEYSLPDIIRINSFKVEVDLKCQHFKDAAMPEKQMRIRNIEELKEFINSPHKPHKTKNRKPRKLKTYEDFLDHAFVYDGPETLEEQIHALGGTTFEELQERINQMMDNAYNKLNDRLLDKSWVNDEEDEDF